MSVSICIYILGGLNDLVIKFQLFSSCQNPSSQFYTDNKCTLLMSERCFTRPNSSTPYCPRTGHCKRYDDDETRGVCTCSLWPEEIPTQNRQTCEKTNATVLNYGDACDGSRPELEICRISRGLECNDGM